MFAETIKLCFSFCAGASFMELIKYG